jgi:hypothetical protein
VRVLVHVGYHKTGSNWLQRELFDKASAGYRWLGKRPATHPVWRLVADRALEFDSVEVRRDFEPLLLKAEERGLQPVVSLERLSGHPFSGGHDSSQIAERLSTVLPDSRILIVVREQHAVIVSTYKQYVKAGGACTLPQFLDSPTKQNWRVPWFDFRQFEYDHLIRKYHSLYGQENVLVLPFEQFVRDGRGFVERIAGFAEREIPEDVIERLPFTRRSNPSPSAITIAALRRLNQFTPRTELNPSPFVESRLTARLAARLKKSDALAAIVPGVLVTKSDARLRRLVAEAAGDRYAASNRATGELIGVDLAVYGWPVEA